MHLVFSPKNREHWIKPKWEGRLHSYMAGALQKYESPAIIINSKPDHIHILFRLSKNYALAKVVEEVKKQSSKWIKTIDVGSSHFYWRIGYASFSISSYNVEMVRRYIANQKEHQKDKSYRIEVEDFVKVYDVIEYDSEYFWD